MFRFMMSIAGPISRSNAATSKTSDTKVTYLNNNKYSATEFFITNAGRKASKPPFLMQPKSQTVPSSKSRDTKTRTDIKNLLRTKARYCSVVSESVVICQLTLKMGEAIDFENQRISNFKGLVTLTLDRVIRHTVVHHSSTSTYIPNFIRIGKKLFVDGRTDGHETHVTRSTLRSRKK